MKMRDYDYRAGYEEWYNICEYFKYLLFQDMIDQGKFLFYEELYIMRRRKCKHGLITVCYECCIEKYGKPEPFEDWCKRVCKKSLRSSTDLERSATNAGQLEVRILSGGPKE